MSNIEQRIVMITSQVDTLAEEKSQIEEKIDKTLRDISRLAKSIRKTEQEIRSRNLNNIRKEC